VEAAGTLRGLPAGVWTAVAEAPLPSVQRVHVLGVREVRAQRALLLHFGASLPSLQGGSVEMS
jgi:hypothetical protein